MSTTRIYIAPFDAPIGPSYSSSCGSMITSSKNASRGPDWPYDIGDDPSFYAMRRFGGQLSWGICRQDVRNPIRRGDIVVFFSFRRFRETGDCEYRLCALATVTRKVRQIDLWRKPHLRRYTRYFNLLIRPSRSTRGRWEHFEPSFNGARVHKDWLWRIADHSGLRKDDFRKIQEANYVESGATIRNRPLVIAANYVLFSSARADTHVIIKPPVVAWYSQGNAAEEWNRDAFSQGVEQRTLEFAAKSSGRSRSLRIRNSQRAHRHIVFELLQPEAERWRAEFLHFVRAR